MIVLSRKDVSSILTPAITKDLVAKALVVASTGGAILPLRTAIDVGENNRLGIMPGSMPNAGCFGVKLISLYPDNPSKGLSSHSGIMVAFESENGQPTAIMDAGILTAIRTSAASAVATDLLARKDAETLLIVGTGEQAEYHLDAMLSVRNIKQVRIVGRNIDKTQKFVSVMRERHRDLVIAANQDVRDAAKGADLICTITSSCDTVLQGKWVDPGCHVNAVGASIPSMREIDEDLIAISSLFVDYRPSAFAQAGDIIEALENGRITKSHIIGEIGEVLMNKAQGRTHDDEITLFRSLGIAAEDLICANHAFEIAAQRGIGTRVSVA
jgi:ornithine cyclodeaminase